MHGIAHLCASWSLSQGAGDNVRDRRIVAWAGVLPDLDCLAWPLGHLLGGSNAVGYTWHRAIHHYYTHGLLAVCIAAAVGGVFGKSRWRTGGLAAAAVLLHLLMDLAGSGAGWPIYPFWPLSDWPLELSWSFSLTAWPNRAANALLVIFSAWLAIRVRRTPVEMVSVRMDRDLAKRLPSSG